MYTEINMRDYLPSKLVECALKIAVITNVQWFDPFLLNIKDPIKLSGQNSRHKKSE